jgi:hypothetical protein
LVESSVGGSKRGKNQNVVKRTVRYQSGEDFRQNGGMKIENDGKNEGEGRVGGAGHEAAGAGRAESGMRNAECGMGNNEGNAASKLAGEEGEVSKIGNFKFEKGEGGRAGARNVVERRTVRRGRCDSILRRLPPEQRAKVDGWLFDDQLTYGEVAERCRQELGVELDTASVGRYCRQEQGRRPKPADDPLPMVDPGSRYVTLLESMSEKALRAVWKLELESDPKAIAEFARVLVAARQEANQALRAATTREKFEFDAATACLIHQVKVSSIAADEALDDGERILKIREELFGPNLPT